MSEQPFGIKFQSNTAFIKLRFKKDKFDTLNIKQYGAFRTTQSGFIIFQTELSIYSMEYKELMTKLGKKPA